MSNSLVEKLAKIQTKLKAPKSQYNSFGKYAFRNSEDILEAVKPLLGEQNLIMTISDDVVMVGNRIYVKSVVNVSDGENFVINSAFAREPEDRKGMDASQITGATSSYARKYALNGMFLIDDTKDADATNDHGKGEQKPVEKAATKTEAAASPKSESQALTQTNTKPADKPASRFAPKNKPAETKTTAAETAGGDWE